jgi:hypothetical protein
VALWAVDRRSAVVRQRSATASNGSLRRRRFRPVISLDAEPRLIARPAARRATAAAQSRACNANRAEA